MQSNGGMVLVAYCVSEKIHGAIKGKYKLYKVIEDVVVPLTANCLSWIFRVSFRSDTVNRFHGNLVEVTLVKGCFLGQTGTVRRLVGRECVLVCGAPLRMLQMVAWVSYSEAADITRRLAQVPTCMDKVRLWRESQVPDSIRTLCEELKEKLLIEK